MINLVPRLSSKPLETSISDIDVSRGFEDHWHIPYPTRGVHGWGMECANGKPVIGKWWMRIMDINGKPTELPFDVVEGRSPLILGLDVEKFSNSHNIGCPKSITIMRPTIDKEPRKFFTYIGQDQTGSERKRLEILPHDKSTVTTLMANIVSRYEINLAKKVHRYSHAHESEMINLFKNAGILTPPLALACRKVVDACDACKGSGRRGIKRKISLSHVNQAFNEEIQADFATVRFKDANHEVLNVVDTGTTYGLRLIVPDRSAKTMKKLLEKHWFLEFGAPKSFSADPEFTRGVMERFLQLHDVTLQQRPARSSNKNGIVERQNGVFKMIMERLSKHDKTSEVDEVVARASLFTNLIKGSNVLSSFQLAKGYSPSILGMPRKFVPQELLDAHVEITAARAIHKVLKGKAPRVEQRNALTPGREVWVYLRTTKPEPVEWIEATVDEAKEHLVKCRRTNKGPPMLVSYEDIRIRPKGELTRALMSQNFTEELDVIALKATDRNNSEYRVNDGLESNDATPDQPNNGQPEHTTRDSRDHVVANYENAKSDQVALQRMEQLQFRSPNDTDSETSDESNRDDAGSKLNATQHDQDDPHHTTTLAFEQESTDDLGITDLAKSLSIESPNDSVIPSDDGVSNEMISSVS